VILSMVKVLYCWRDRDGPLKSKHTPLTWAKVSTECVEHNFLLCVYAYIIRSNFS